MKAIKYFIFLLPVLVSCIGDDFIDDLVEPEIRISNSIDTIALNSSYQFEHQFLNQVGQEESVSPTWSSSNPSIIDITSNGLATALELGNAEIRVEYDTGSSVVQDSKMLVVGETTISNDQTVTGQIVTTSSYVLEGDFEFAETEDGVSLSLADNWVASSSLPGLYVYLSNNRNSIANAHEIAEVEVFNGAHNYHIEGVGFSDFQYIVYFCKPFNVKVGEGEL